MKELSQEELQRYSRHFSLPEVGVEGQKRLKAAKVLCIGAGGLGSPLLLYLSAAGVGTIGILDDDKVELSNLQRQILFTAQDLEQKKVEAAKIKLQSLNPHTQLILHDQRLNTDNALEIISQYDIVADGSDNFATRYLVNDMCFRLKKPLVYASIFQFKGQCSVFASAHKHSPCYQCLYESPPESAPNCTEAGVLGVLPGVMGSIQAAEVIKLILNIGSPLIGRLLTFDALSMQFQEFSLTKNPGCPVCNHQNNFETSPNQQPNKSHNITVHELKQLQNQAVPFLLLDVREPHEFALCNLGGRLIPLGQLAEKMHELDKTQRIIVHCKMGGRGQKAVELLQQAGFLDVQNLAGGINAWAKEIDPSLPIY